MFTELITVNTRFQGFPFCRESKRIKNAIPAESLKHCGISSVFFTTRIADVVDFRIRIRQYILKTWGEQRFMTFAKLYFDDDASRWIFSEKQRVFAVIETKYKSFGLQISFQVELRKRLRNFRSERILCSSLESSVPTMEGKFTGLQIK